MFADALVSPVKLTTVLRMGPRCCVESRRGATVCAVQPPRTANTRALLYLSEDNEVPSSPRDPSNLSKSPRRPTDLEEVTESGESSVRQKNESLHRSLLEARLHYESEARERRRKEGGALFLSDDGSTDLLFLSDVANAAQEASPELNTLNVSAAKDREEALHRALLDARLRMTSGIATKSAKETMPRGRSQERNLREAIDLASSRATTVVRSHQPFWNKPELGVGEGQQLNVTSSSLSKALIPEMNMKQLRGSDAWGILDAIISGLAKSVRQWIAVALLLSRAMYETAADEGVAGVLNASVCVVSAATEHAVRIRTVRAVLGSWGAAVQSIALFFWAVLSKFLSSTYLENAVLAGAEAIGYAGSAFLSVLALGGKVVGGAGRFLNWHSIAGEGQPQRHRIGETDRRKKMKEEEDRLTDREARLEMERNRINDERRLLEQIKTDIEMDKESASTLYIAAVNLMAQVLQSQSEAADNGKKGGRRWWFSRKPKS